MQEAICARCLHLRDTTSPKGQEHYRACGYPEPPIPAVLGWPSSNWTEGRRLITRTMLADTTQWLGMLQECPTFEPITAIAEQETDASCLL